MDRPDPLRPPTAVRRDALLLPLLWLAAAAGLVLLVRHLGWPAPPLGH